MTENEFDALVRDAIKELPERIRGAMDNVGFVVEARARRKKAGEVGIRVGETLLGLYEGVPLVERGEGYVLVPPDKITIFRDPIVRDAGGDPAKMQDLVREVVWHEIGHHLGFDDRELRAIERKRARRRTRRILCDR